MARASYSTKQRSSIYDFFLGNKEGCYTAKQIAQALGDQAGGATVYRTLADFTAKGLLIKYTDDNKLTYYRLKDCSTAGHFHLKCTDCGELIHMECEEMSKVALHIEKEHGFLVDSGITTLYGLCRNCRRKAEENEKNL